MVRFAQRTPATDVHIEQWDGDQFATRLDDAMYIYTQAMDYPAYTGAQRGVSARKHARHDGFACRAAVAEDGTLVGFGYGYRTAPGQWWHDLVRRALTRQGAQEWLDDAFELSELHVRPERHGQGIGRSLLLQLCADVSESAVLLSTPDRDTRAFRLYRDTGFVDLARNYLFPGDSRPFAVLGARRPLRG